MTGWKLFAVEPRRNDYRTLIALAAKSDSTFSLTWRDDISFHQRAYGLKDLLLPCLIKECHSDHWPGNRIASGKAWVCRYAIVSESLEVLNGVNGLYDWREPRNPEDLAFYGDGGEPWLMSAAHEAMSWVDPSFLAEDVLNSFAPLFDLSKFNPP